MLYENNTINYNNNNNNNDNDNNVNNHICHLQRNSLNEAQFLGY